MTIFFHNYYRLKHGFKKGKETYNGSFHCGVTSYVLGNLLKKRRNKSENVSTRIRVW
jgi:hypothetical protein